MTQQQQQEIACAIADDNQNCINAGVIYRVINPAREEEVLLCDYHLGAGITVFLENSVPPIDSVIVAQVEWPHESESES